MREFIIGSNEAQQRLDKYLKKLLPNASTGFLYKMMRKKNITCNGKKVTGKESLKKGDTILLKASHGMGFSSMIDTMKELQLQ